MVAAAANVSNVLLRSRQVGQAKALDTMRAFGCKRHNTSHDDMGHEHAARRRRRPPPRHHHRHEQTSGRRLHTLPAHALGHVLPTSVVRVKPHHCIAAVDSQGIGRWH